MNLKDFDAVIIPVNARGITTGRATLFAAQEFPTSFAQYQNTCSRKAFMGDATGRVRKKRLVSPGDVLHYVDLASDDYRDILTATLENEIDDVNLKERYDERKKHVFFMVVRGRNDKPFQTKNLGRMFTRIQDELDAGSRAAIIMWDNHPHVDAVRAAITETITDIDISIL